MIDFAHPSMFNFKNIKKHTIEIVFFKGTVPLFRPLGTGTPFEIWVIKEKVKNSGDFLMWPGYLYKWPGHFLMWPLFFKWGSH